jgi:hypothetical protein
MCAIVFPSLVLQRIKETGVSVRTFLAMSPEIPISWLDESWKINVSFRMTETDARRHVFVSGREENVTKLRGVASSAFSRAISRLKIVICYF